MEIFNREALVNVIIELFEIDIQELLLGKELAEQFPEPFLVLISNHMHNFGSIVDCIYLRGMMFFLASIFSDVLQQQLLCAQIDFKLRWRLM